jgi:hypothetical protein
MPAEISTKTSPTPQYGCSKSTLVLVVVVISHAF